MRARLGTAESFWFDQATAGHLAGTGKAPGEESYPNAQPKTVIKGKSGCLVPIRVHLRAVVS